MSYILEALRRAEAQRQRGAVPGLHAQAPSTALADQALARQAQAHRSWHLAWIFAASLLLLIAGVWGGWLWTSRLAPTVGAAQPFAIVPAVGIAPAQAVEPAPATPLAAPALAASGALAASAALLSPSLRPSPVVAAPSVASALVVPPLAASAPAPASVPRLPTLAELPEALRRDLPALGLGGSVYAEQASQRMVIINGQVFHEGDRVAPELLLQQIRLRSVLLDYRGQRFELPF